MTAPTARPARPGARLAWRPLQRSTRVAIIGALAATIFYQLFLLNPAYRGPGWLWVTMLAAEGLTALHLVGTWWTILAHDDRAEPVDVTVWRNRLRAGGDVPSIDVFITAYGEDPALVRRTVLAARDMDLPHRTFLLDDGDSDELARIAADAGVGYLRRPGGAHAKAGNVNAGLARTDGEFVVILDADHVPEPGFLLSILPHFQDPEVAFVQSPQSYTNNVNLVATGSGEAQRIFYELVCPGKNHFNAAFCVGTNVMFRRAALDSIGGIWIGSNSEDIWTSIELHKRGWKSIYVPQVLARGLAPQDVPSYLKQQLRWASGGFEVLLRGRLFKRGIGLTIDQRLQYLFCGTHYLLSVAMLTFMLFPALYLLFALSPIRADGLAWATHYLPFQAAVLLVTWLQSGGFKLSAIVASIGATPVHLRALGGVLLGRPAKWKVTNAGGDGARSLWAVMPLVAILLLNSTAIVVGVLVMADPAPTWLSVGWASMIVLILGRMIIESVTGGRIRRRVTPPSAAPVDARSATVEDSATTKVIAVAAVA
ncbi:glycosyltransferase family 2 protein [Actinoplanes friuliensis]|uniref:Cellulose synthase n=1 Tax=Actinoplanes friuliensis DSM 7358 TaxID=1246995 RepID=U5VW17_9ACTN|nr:glycosyltransferase family 2 protein [Actinoplanes friuliensis]AGZ41039.1 cellulose synthase [Actinoplanes friuliensis DSM 7358]